ncbi:energy transducer TonB [uncultured Pseudoteredinibacter sp.]|uniref:energy transducer TonB n=1 Tax=uncultured Pseudoteredinibacter sp. TaxID=1641701 RepID=UPI00261C42D5|nr:energy transducer TonB [uncultured Pseudoteredinibacter sp.]
MPRNPISFIVRVFALIIILQACSSPQMVFEEEDILAVPADSNEYWETVISHKPRYPWRAFNIGLDGCVNVSYVINKEGKPRSFKILKSSVERVFDSAALTAVQKFRFKPSDDNPERRIVRTNIVVYFLIGGSNKFEDSDPDEVKRRCSLD